MKKKLIIIISILIFALTFVGCTKENSLLTKYTAEHYVYFNTLTQIIAYCENEEEFNQLKDTIFSTLEYYHQLFDIYNNYEGINNLKTVNDEAGKNPVEVSSEIIELISLSKEYYELTNESINIAMGSVLKLWHDYRSEGLENPENAQLPPQEDLLSLNNFTNINDVILTDNTVYLNEENMSLDVGAVGKGFAAQKTIEKLQELGYDNLLLNLGGNVKTIGEKGNDEGAWAIGIDNPKGEGYLVAVELTDLSLVTSGDYQRVYTVEGEEYHHIIDPKTLYPSEYFSSVTVIAQNSATADLLSTALFNMTINEGKELLKQFEDAEAAWINEDNSIEYSENFNKFIK